MPAQPLISNHAVLTIHVIQVARYEPRLTLDALLLLSPDQADHPHYVGIPLLGLGSSSKPCFS